MSSSIITPSLACFVFFSHSSHSFIQALFHFLAIRARSILKADVLEYLDRAFTQKGLKENILGRKKRNYPKRSAIIRADPNTGELVYPGESPQKVRTISKTYHFIYYKTISKLTRNLQIKIVFIKTFRMIIKPNMHEFWYIYAACRQIPSYTNAKVRIYKREMYFLNASYNFWNSF